MMQVQIDVYNIEQQIDREIVRQRGGRHRQMYTTENNRQIERQFDREEEEVGTDRCVQQRTIDRERGRGRYRQMYTTENNRQIERQYDRERGGGGRYRQMYTTQNNRQRERSFDRDSNIE